MSAQNVITIIGGGTMGCGIAVAALLRTDAHVVLAESALSMHETVERRIVDGAAKRGRDDALSRLSVTASIADTPPADLIVEAVPERLDLKREVLQAAVQRLRPNGLIASNTSSLSITELAHDLDRSERFLGMHFFQPVPDTVLTELVLHPGVAPAAVADAEQWTARLGRESIRAQDAPGFATSRLGLAIGLEAMRMLEAGVASADDIDRGMQLGYQHAVGPLRMTDMVGLDVRLAIAQHLAATLGPRFEPPGILQDMVAEGRLGRKTGRGFFTWSE